MTRLISLATLALGGLALAAPAWADQPERFDLVCHGRTVLSVQGIAPTEQADDARMSVDLGRRLWCWLSGAACARVLPIEGVRGTVLALGNALTGQGESHISVDLASGAFSSHIHIRVDGGPDMAAAENGHCAMAPFTGIP